MSPSEVAAAAASLTLPQRDVVFDMKPGETRDYRAVQGKVRRALFARDVLRCAQQWPNLLCELTELGVAVHEHFNEEAKKL